MYKSIGSLFLTKEQRNCPHPEDKIELLTSGSFHFDGEVWDDLKDILVCAECGAEVRLIEKKHIHKVVEVLPI